MIASAVNVAAVRPAANWPPAWPPAEANRAAAASAQRERRQAHNRRQSAPDDHENGDDTQRAKTSWWDMSIPGQRQMTGFTRPTIGWRRALRHGPVRRAESVTRNRKRAPSATPAGTERRTGWRTSESPVPQQSAHGSVQVSPRPPHRVHVPRSGTSRGTTVPADASRRDSHTSVVSTSVPPPSPRNPWRTRSTKGPTDGKSIAISSAKQSCSRLAEFDDRHTPGNGWNRKESRLTAKPE